MIEGFVATGIGTNTLSVAVSGSSLVTGLSDGSLFVGAASLAPLSTTSLSPGVTNYVEVSLSQDTGGSDSRAFWDPTAAGGAGAEFSQIIDTFTFLKANLNISISNFSGDTNRVKICEVDVNGSGVITAIRDRRDLYFRLGRGTNPTFSFPWSSRVEPPNTQFTGADKSIKTQKQLNDAFSDSIREIKGTTYWFEQSPITLPGVMRNAGLSVITAATTSAMFSWDGSNVRITDSNGSPLDSDVLAYIRLFDSSSVISLTRQDGINSIAISNDDVLWVELPDPLTNVSYDGVGSTSSNYRVTPRGSVPLDQDTYWLAYRDGSRLYVKGLGELEAGESHQITDETTTALATFLGFDPEVATSVPYTTVPVGSFPATFTTADTLVTAISAISTDLNFIQNTLNADLYEEPIDIIAGVPSDDNQYTGPVLPGTTLTLPLDSKDGNSTKFYTVGSGELVVFLNGQYLRSGDDFDEVGSVGSQSNQVQIQINLEILDTLEFRILGHGGSSGGGGGGEANTGTNVGTGAGVFKDKVGVTLRFKRLNAGSGVTVTENTDDITIASSATPANDNVTIVNGADYTATAANDFILMSLSGADHTVTLPTAVGNSGKRIRIKLVDSGFTLHVKTVLNQTIDLVNCTTGSLDTSTQFDVIEVESDGSNWWVI